MDELVCHECGTRDSEPTQFQRGWRQHNLDDEHLVWTCPYCSAVDEPMTEKIFYSMASPDSYSYNN
jgi:hypothetical protein